MLVFLSKVYETENSFFIISKCFVLSSKLRNMYKKVVNNKKKIILYCHKKGLLQKPETP